MRVLMLNYEYPPIGGGAGNATYYLLREFGKRHDLTVDLVTSSATGRFEEEHPADNITIYKLPLRKKSVHFWTMREIVEWSIHAYRLCNRLIRKKRYDVCHCWFGWPPGFLGYLFRNQIPYLVALRGSDIPGSNPRLRLYDLFFLRYVSKIVWKKANIVTVLSQKSYYMAKNLVDRDFVIIPNGIDTREFYPIGKREQRMTILSVGRLTKGKRISDLIRAIPTVLKDCPDLLVRIIGEGNTADELHNIARELNVEKNVEFQGYIPHSELPDFYTSSDIFVLPSLSEGMSNTVLEAMAAGLPIITTETGGTKELISGNGLVVPTGRPDLIAGAILRYISDPSLRRDHGIRSRVLAESMDWSCVAYNYIRLYEELV